MNVHDYKHWLPKILISYGGSLWGEHIGIQYRGEEKVSREKLQQS